MNSICSAVLGATYPLHYPPGVVNLYTDHSTTCYSMFLEAKQPKGRRQHGHAPIMTPGGEKKLLSSVLDENGSPSRLPLSSHPIVLLAPVDSTSLSATGTRRYVPSMGPSTRRTSVGLERKSRYRSTYQSNNRDLHFRREEDQSWSEHELQKLQAAVDEFGDLHAWSRIARDVGTKTRLDCRMRWEKHGRSQSSMN
jgi:hypothetical protein